jgi:hypothetical protein
MKETFASFVLIFALYALGSRALSIWERIAETPPPACSCVKEGDGHDA